MITVNGRTYNIDTAACLRAYFKEDIGWHDIHTSAYFTDEERATFFGPDINLRTMKAVRLSPEWVEIVTEFAKKNGIDVPYAIRKAIYFPRGPQKKTQKAKPAPQTDIENKVVQSVCTEQAKTTSDVEDLQTQVNYLRMALVEANHRIETLEGKVADLETKEDRTYKLVPVDTE